MSEIKAFALHLAKTLLLLVCLSFTFQPSLAQANTSTQVQAFTFDAPLLALTSVTLVSLIVIPITAGEDPLTPPEPTEFIEPPCVTALVNKILKRYPHVTLAEATLVVNYVFLYAEKYHIRPALLIGMISAESSFKRKAVSAHGAMGYYQVMPRYHRSKIRGRNVLDTAVNIQVGATILNDCLKLTGSEHRALACYNGATRPKDVASYTRLISKHVSFFS